MIGDMEKGYVLPLGIESLCKNLVVDAGFKLKRNYYKEQT